MIFIFLLFFFRIFIFPLVYPFFAYSLDELDFNQDGVVTFSEFIYVSDYGERDINMNGEICIEYFSLKDANTLKIECPSGYRKIRGK